MKKHFSAIGLVLILYVLQTACTVNKPIAQVAPAAKAEDTTKIKAPAKKTAKGYSDFITKEAITDSGVFTIHKVDEKYYFEIPDSLLHRDFLWITRFASLPLGLGGGYVNAGSEVNEQLVEFEKYGDKILIKNKSYTNFAADSLPINISVQANNYQPTIFAFDIAAYTKNSTAMLVDVSKFFQTDIKAISALNANMRRDYKVSRLDENRSFISSIKSFPLNIEVRQDFTYDAAEPPSNASTGAISLQANQSIVLLPVKPMQPRINDDRVGYFTVKKIDYGSEALKADEIAYIRRWRLEPKDLAAYKRGELTEPVKPIVYYLDPATPDKLRPFIKEGVEAWQKVFEKAGFKNAILAKDPPTKQEDPDFNPEDVRYSVIRYVASTTRNAVGPSVSDPRSGEIIESDIIWYHNHLRSYRNRYLLETGAANPAARTLNTPMDDLGEMMKYVITHEVGHALGLPHNMKASSAYPTNSLRSGTFTQKYGIAATIMDYARYNYVAQPGDKNVRFVRQLGPYDDYAINWGYRYLPDAKSAQDEVSTLSKWINDKTGNPIYMFGSGSGGYDPDSQTEGIGNDVVKSSEYGLNNLKKVVPQLYNWTAKQTNDYDDLSELYDELLSVWSRYIGHVVTNVGGIHRDLLRPDQKGFVFTPVSAKKQKASMNWLLENAFTSPAWLHQADISRNIEPAGYVESIRSLQVRHLNILLSPDKMARLMENVVDNIDYNALDMVSQLQTGIWSEIYKGGNIDIFRRNLQKAYLERMNYLLNEEPVRSGRGGAPAVDINQSDIRSIVRGEITALQQQLIKASQSGGDQLTKFHINDCFARISDMLTAKKK